MKKLKKALFIACLLFVGQLSAQSLQSGIKDIELEKYPKAKSFFKAAIEKDPENVEAYYYLGKTYMESEDLDSAKIMFQKAATLDPKNPFTHISAGIIGLENDNSQEYKPRFDKAMSIAGPKDMKILLMVAEAYINSSNKKLTDAIDLLNKAIEDNPKNPELYIALGNAYLEQGNGGQAVANYEKANQVDKPSAKAYTKIGQLYTRAKNFNEAKAGFENAIKADSLYASAYKGIAELYVQAKKVELALENYRTYMRLSDPNSVQARSRYASFLFLNKEHAKAAEIINEVIKTDSSNIIMKRLLAYSLYEQKDYEKGLKYIESFLAKVDKKKILASDYEYYGKLLAKNDKDSLAIENFKKALEKDPSKNEVYHEMALSYNRLKKFGEAAKAYQTKIANSKPTVADYVYLGRALYNNGNYEKSDSIFEIVTTKQPAYHQAYIYRGRNNAAMDEKNDPKLYEAKEYYEKAIELGSLDMAKNKKDVLEAYNYLLFYYVQIDDKKTAKEINNKILELDPENKEAKDRVKQLK
jgi:tetratricopeptide (TPR) repeat protein